MGKKSQKKRVSHHNISSLSSEELQNSACDSFNVSNNSLCEGSVVPEKFFVCSAESARCTEYIRYLKSDWQDVIFLHPSVMRAYDIEDLVLIEGEQKTVLCNAYPLSKLKKTHIVFPKGTFPFKNQELVSLSSYEGKIKCAQEIVISLANERYNDKTIENLIFRLLCNKYIYVGLTVQWKLFDRAYNSTIKSISCLPDISNLSLNSNGDFYVVNHKTVLKTDSQTVECENKSAFSHIGGLEKQLKSIKKYMQMFLSYDNCTSSVYCGTLILEGPSGTGKSLLLEAILEDCKIYKECILWYKICAMSQSELKKELKFAFQKAVDRAPSVIVLDEFNHLCPSRNKAAILHQYISKIISQLLETLDESKVMVIAAVNDSDYDTFALQTPKRIIEIIKFPIPTTFERIDILKKLLISKHHELTVEHIELCAKLAHGFTGKDLLTVIEDAQMLAYKREFSDLLDSDEFSNTLRSGSGNTVRIRFCDLELCVKMKKPTIVSANDMKVKKVQWSDIGGMRDVKEKLKQLVEWPLKYPEAFKHFNITPSRGVLMYGPPGCSKTMIAKALATECELNFISKNASDLFDKYVGESEKAVRNLFALATAKSPCIIFLDEIDALVAERGSSSSSSGVGDRIVTTLLTEMDGIEELQGVIIIAATNRPDMLDDALVRNGRINHFIYVPLPDVATREEILKLSMRNRIVSEDFDFKTFAEKTDGYSGAEIVNLCNEAALQLLAEDPEIASPVFQVHHFERALKYVHPRTSKDIVKFYESFNQKFS